MPIDLSAIPYQHRFSGASLLTAKANRLLDTASAAAGKAKPDDPKPVRAALAYFEMALSLLKPYDPNYPTILNWKCNALLQLHQYETAVGEYREIIRLTELTDGQVPGNAYAKLAAEMIAQHAGKKNTELPPEDPAQARAFDDPPYCMHGETFCRLLVEGKFKQAHAYLSPALQQKQTVADLKASWRAMMGDADRHAIDVLLGQHLTDWPARRADEIAWCYYTVCSEDVNEAITLVVVKTPSHAYTITELEFGRP